MSRRASAPPTAEALARARAEGRKAGLLEAAAVAKLYDLRFAADVHNCAAAGNEQGSDFAAARTGASGTIEGQIKHRLLYPEADSVAGLARDQKNASRAYREAVTRAALAARRRERGPTPYQRRLLVQLLAGEAPALNYAHVLHGKGVTRPERAAQLLTTMGLAWWRGDTEVVLTEFGKTVARRLKSGRWKMER